MGLGSCVGDDLEYVELNCSSQGQWEADEGGEVHAVEAVWMVLGGHGWCLWLCVSVCVVGLKLFRAHVYIGQVFPVVYQSKLPPLCGRKEERKSLDLIWF